MMMERSLRAVVGWWRLILSACFGRVCYFDDGRYGDVWGSYVWRTMGERLGDRVAALYPEERRKDWWERTRECVCMCV